MKLIKNILCEGVSINDLETSPRIEKKSMIGYYAVVHDKFIWKSNLETEEEAQEVVKIYHAIKGPVELKIVKVTE